MIKDIKSISKSSWGSQITPTLALDMIYKIKALLVIFLNHLMMIKNFINFKIYKLINITQTINGKISKLLKIFLKSLPLSLLTNNLSQLTIPTLRRTTFNILNH